MWKNRRFNLPEKSGVCLVFGTVNKGTKHENKEPFFAFWDSSKKHFSDLEGEDLTGINDSVEFWFDLSQISNPI